MATTEHTINDALAGLLRTTRWVWHTSDVIRSENSQLLQGNQARPDILIIEPLVSPVIVETEIYPAQTVEKETLARLGQLLRGSGEKILSAIAVRLPKELRDVQGEKLQQVLAEINHLEMALFTGKEPTKATRWPETGWLTGSVADLSVLIQAALLPPDLIEEAVDEFIVGVSQISTVLGQIIQLRPGIMPRISQFLRQEGNEQTLKMAATILTNAFIFQESLAYGPGELAQVRNFQEMIKTEGALYQSTIINEWNKILKVNYWPIFDIAARILSVIPSLFVGRLIERLADTTQNLLNNRLMRSHDLTGAIFQRLISDRKFLAAYYTTPASAALLVWLAITPTSLLLQGSWANPEDVKNLRIADFACGTGTLLSTAYQRISQLHELAGGNTEKLHPQMMANALVGCDILPAATHLTATMLSGAYPTTKYDQSSILTFAYGKQEDGAIALGSLDLLDPQGKFEILAITAKVAEGMGEGEMETWRSLPHASFDMVIMNPPFTRATGHEGEKIGVPNPMFAAFNSTKEEQKLMSEAIERLTKDTVAHGNAGEASMFLALADRKLKQNGVLALVMPLSILSGEAWEKARLLLAQNYRNLILISIAGGGSKEMSFSADTGMGECLIIGRKAEEGSQQAIFVVLDKSPSIPIFGITVAKQIQHMMAQNHLRSLEDGPIGGTPLYFGKEIVGQLLKAPLPAAGGWHISRISDLSLAQTAYQLATHYRLWLPTMPQSKSVVMPMKTVGEIGQIGPYHADINGFNNIDKTDIRGPFNITAIKPKTIPTYPVLWAHNAPRERTLLFEADSEGTPRVGKTAVEKEKISQKTEKIWRTASFCHFNRDFQFNSQSTAMQLTPRKTIGGRAWLSISLPTLAHEKALVLWANTSLGLLIYWWFANKQQAGRGSIGKQVLETVPVLDVTTFTETQLNKASQLFDELSNQPLLPAHQLHLDPVRCLLDEKFAKDILGLEQDVVDLLENLRLKLSQEPSIQGSKGKQKSKK